MNPLHANPPPVLAVEKLVVSYQEQGQWHPTVHEVSFEIHPGQVLALVGESGSGKSTTAQAIIGLLADNGRVDSGQIRINGQEISGWSSRHWDAIRGRVVSLIPQDPVASLNPVKTIGDQVAEVLRLHQRLDRKALAAEVVALLERVGLSQPELRARQYPHELSGGMRQRVLIAIALALKPALIIADEPTSALDVTVQQRILDLIDTLRQESGTAVLLVTHDLGVAADRADALVVLQQGRIQEAGPTATLLQNPASAYTRQLLRDAPSIGNQTFRSAPLRADAETVVAVQGIRQAFRLRGQKEPLTVLQDVSFTIPKGSTHAIVGESGAGKTTLIRSILGLLKPDAGQILIHGIDLASQKGEALRQLRRRIQLVYQNPYRSLDPRQRVFDIIEEPLLNYEKIPAAERRRRVEALFQRVGLPANLLQRRPAGLSGGQRQRVAIARALILQPEVLVLDEAVSALDVTVQAQILTLLETLQQELELTYLFVSHDLAVISRIADTVSVLEQGHIVESGPVRELFLNPRHPYTQELIEAIPGKRRPHLVQPQPSQPLSQGRTTPAATALPAQA